MQQRPFTLGLVALALVGLTACGQPATPQAAQTPAPAPAQPAAPAPAPAGNSQQPAAAEPKAPAFTVKVNGEEMATSGKEGAHTHENDSLHYAVLSDLTSNFEAESVSLRMKGEVPVLAVNGTEFQAPQGAQGPHFHGSELYVPIETWAEILGYTVTIEGDGKIISLTKAE